MRTTKVTIVHDMRRRAHDDGRLPSATTDTMIDAGKPPVEVFWIQHPDGLRDVHLLGPAIDLVVESVNRFSMEEVDI